jgi:hypothetical protein
MPGSRESTSFPDKAPTRPSRTPRAAPPDRSSLDTRPNPPRGPTDRSSLDAARAHHAPPRDLRPDARRSRHVRLALIAALAVLASSAPADAQGLTWTLPAGWRDVAPQLTAVTEPRHQLAAASFDLRQSKPDRSCSPEAARRQMPRDGALVLLLESRETAARPRALARLPRRPERFRLGRPVNLECFGAGWTVVWGEQGRALQAVVMYGPRAGAERRRQAEALLDSLVVQPVPPPPPPAGWRDVVSDAADSMRVPPGWSARALRDKRATPRPRLLFRLANREKTVVVRVREHPRGPVSRAFPHAREPLVFENGRAGLAWRGFRYSVRIFARLGATARDLGWAELSARTLGVSGSGRG